MRSLMVQGAGCVIRLATCGKLKSKQLNEVDFEEAKRKNAVGKTSMRRCRKAFTDR